MTWVDLTTAFAYGSSPTSEQLQNLRDNLTAFANGDSGAPTVQSAGLASSAVTTSKIANANVDRSKLKTSGGSVSGNINDYVSYAHISLQDYCFGVNAYGEDVYAVPFYLMAYSSISASYVARFTFFSYTSYWDGTDGSYRVYYRYVTSSDKPFIYAMQNSEGEFIATWESDDPPPGYWGLDRKPIGFKPPVFHQHKDGTIIKPHRDIVLFDQDKEFMAEIRGKAQADKKRFIDVLNGYDYSDGLFIPKTILEI